MSNKLNRNLHYINFIKHNLTYDKENNIKNKIYFSKYKNREEIY